MCSFMMNYFLPLYHKYWVHYKVHIKRPSNYYLNFKTYQIFYILTVHICIFVCWITNFLLLDFNFFFLLEYKNTGIVFGGILGAILGASLLSLVGYLLCGQRKTDSFSHRRLYDDRNEPGKNYFQTITPTQWF